MLIYSECVGQMNVRDLKKTKLLYIAFSLIQERRKENVIVGR